VLLRALLRPLRRVLPLLLLLALISLLLCPIPYLLLALLLELLLAPPSTLRASPSTLSAPASTLSARFPFRSRVTARVTAAARVTALSKFLDTDRHSLLYYGEGGVAARENFLPGLV
jgi:hypothetical protein